MMMLQDRQRGNPRVSVHVPVQGSSRIPHQGFLAGSALTADWVSRALLFPQLQAEMLWLRKEREKKHPLLPVKTPHSRATCHKHGPCSSLSIQHVSSIIYCPGGEITIHNSQAVMFYKLELAIWLCGPRAAFPGLPHATSKDSFLIAKRHKSSSHLQVDTALRGILVTAGYGVVPICPCSSGFQGLPPMLV